METSPQVDRFLYRLLGGIAFGAGLLLSYFAADLAFDRIPRRAAIFEDFGTELPRSTQYVIQVPWLALVVTLAGTTLAILSMIRVKRTTLATAWIVVMLGALAVAITEFASRAPMDRLIEVLTLVD